MLNTILAIYWILCFFRVAFDKVTDIKVLCLCSIASNATALAFLAYTEIINRLKK